LSRRNWIGFDINKKPLDINYSDNVITYSNSSLKQTRNIENNNISQYKISFNNSTNLNYYIDKLRSKLISRGLIETINWSFIEDKIVDLFCNRDENLLLKNPVSVEMNYLRPTLAIGILNSYKKNSLRNFQNLSIIEIAKKIKKKINSDITILPIDDVRSYRLN
jgi:phenylalanyl-tRNA synthetase beta subunit